MTSTVSCEEISCLGRVIWWLKSFLTRYWWLIDGFNFLPRSKYILGWGWSHHWSGLTKRIHYRFLPVRTLIVGLTAAWLQTCSFLRRKFTRVLAFWSFRAETGVGFVCLNKNFYIEKQRKMIIMILLQANRLENYINTWYIALFFLAMCSLSGLW